MPENQAKSKKRNSPPRRSMILDAVHPRDFRELNFIYCCEQCTHYAPDTNKCTMGFNPERHRREVQLKTYELTGKMAFCRMQEID